MKKKLVFSILAMIPAVLMPLAASCQIVLDKPPAEPPEHVYKYEAYVGFGYTSLNQINQSRYGLMGINASVTRDFGKYFGVIAEGDYYWHPVSTGNPVDAKVLLLMAGPVLHIDIYERFSGFMRGYIGGAHTGGASAYPDVSFAGRSGGGMEYRLNPRVSIRVSGDDILSSFVEDPNHLGFSPHRRGNPRAAVGAVYRF